MVGSPAHRVLEFARRLQRTASFRELLEVTGREVEAELGYHHVWLVVLDPEDPTVVRVLDAQSPLRENMYAHATTIPIAGDRMMEEILGGTAPVVVTDARTDPRTNKELVGLLGNRTIVNVPLVLVDSPHGQQVLGSLGVGTFGDEGVRVPTPEQLEYLTWMVEQIAVAASRMRLAEQSRLAELERKQLEARIAQIQRLESVGELAGGVAHDFNNLLTVILSAATLARESTSTEDLHADLDAVIEAATRGHALTQQLLSMSRAQPLAVATFSPNERVTSLLPLLRRMIPEHVTIDFIPHHQDGQIEADATQFDQVIMNLAINARDAMPGGGRLTLEIEHVLVNGTFRETHPWAKPGRYVLITVTDNGVGMTRDVLDKAFEPFFTTKASARGTGLGLSVANGVVRQHGGMLHCYSEPGVGTTFKAYWPIAERSAVVVGTKLDGPIRGGHERLLVAEDDAAVAAVARRILEAAGYEVTVVGDGDAACEAVARGAFDLLLLDVVMPGRATHEVVAEVWRQRPDQRMLLASGYTADGNVAELVRRSSLQLLNKPYNPDDLLRAVRRRLEQA